MVASIFSFRQFRDIALEFQIIEHSHLAASVRCLVN